MNQVSQAAELQMYRMQTVKLSRSQVVSRIADVMTRTRDWKGATIAEMASEIAKKLGWK